MLEPIGEPAVRTTTRVDSNLAVETKDVDLQKTRKAAEERPIESAPESAKPETDTEKETGGYDVDDSGIFFEKYDKDGNVVLRLPPEQKPIDERA